LFGLQRLSGCFISLRFLIVRLTLPGHIHRPGSVRLRHLGEAGGETIAYIPLLGFVDITTSLGWMVFHHRSTLYIAKEPQDQPVAACGCCLDDAEPEQVAIAQYQAQDKGQDAQNKPQHEPADAVYVYFNRFFQMGVWRQGLPLNIKFDR
jgi:hypothetical protein